MSQTRTMYMHTLDGRPAVIQRHPKLGAWLAYAGGRTKVELAASLNQIRGEWNECLDTVSAENGDVRDAYEAFGYVLVRVPRTRCPLCGSLTRDCSCYERQAEDGA